MDGRTPRRLVRLSVRLIALASAAAAAAPHTICAQATSTAVDAPGVRLRAGPSTRTTAVRTLQQSETLTVVGPDSLRRGFYHVRTRRGDEGWVAGEYVRTPESSAGVQPLLAPPPAAPPTVLSLNAPANDVSDAWEKPAPKHSTITLNGARCGPFGKGRSEMDRSTNERKNRADEPAQYHAVQFDAVAVPAKLPWPDGAPTNRDDWTDAQLDEIAPLEGAAVTVTGFVRKIKPQKKSSGTGESTNCGWISEPGTDWHVAFVGRFDDPESKSLVIETTPRFKRKHGSHWLRAQLAAYENPQHHADSVRVSGWLMLDPRHVDHLGHFRNTLWEIHPVTRIEVFRNGAWLDLDNVP